jgi:hypothetical protein
MKIIGRRKAFAAMILCAVTVLVSCGEDEPAAPDGQSCDHLLTKGSYDVTAINCWFGDVSEWSESIPVVLGRTIVRTRELTIDRSTGVAQIIEVLKDKDDATAKCSQITTMALGFEGQAAIFAFKDQECQDAAGVSGKTCSIDTEEVCSVPANYLGPKGSVQCETEKGVLNLSFGDDCSSSQKGFEIVEVTF